MGAAAARYADMSAQINTEEERVGTRIISLSGVDE